MDIMSMLHSVNLFSVIIRIILAILIGGALGLERGQKKHPAGFRTYILVCLGSALVMMTNQYIFQVYHTGDIGRLGAQVISGIGFLGAGTIIITGRNQVRGLTTAAGLWAAACIGLSIGIGFYEGAIAGGFSIFFVMTVLRRLDDKIKENSQIIDLYLEFDTSIGLGSFIAMVKRKDMEVSDIQVIKNKTAGKKATSVLLSARLQPNQSHAEVVQMLESVEGLICIEEL